MTAAVKGFVLAAGFGQRMLPITETVPKPLLPVGNLPLVGYALKLLRHHGIHDVFLNTHHLARAVRDALLDGAAYDVRLTYSHEDEIMGTGGALKLVHEHLDSTLVVVNSDTIIDVDLHAALAEHRARGALATMVLRQTPPHKAYGQIEIDLHGRIVRILGQGQTGLPSRSLMFTGVHIIEARFLEYVPPGLHTCIIRQGYQKALAHQEPLYAHVCDSFWADAGTPADYLQVNTAALAQTVHLRYADPLAGYELSPKRTVAEVVRMGHDVDLGRATHLIPPLLLGDGARLGERSQVGPGCILGAHAQVGKDAQVRETIVLAGAKVEPRAHLYRMLVGKKAVLNLDPNPHPVS